MYRWIYKHASLIFFIKRFVRGQLSPGEPCCLMLSGDHAGRWHFEQQCPWGVSAPSPVSRKLSAQIGKVLHGSMELQGDHPNRLMKQESSTRNVSQSILGQAWDVQNWALKMLRSIDKVGFSWKTVRLHYSTKDWAGAMGHADLQVFETFKGREEAGVNWPPRNVSAKIGTLQLTG